MNNYNVSFDRGLLKDRAKQVIKTNYWKCFAIALVLSFVTSGGSGGRTINVAKDVSGSSAISGGIISGFSILMMLPLILIMGLIGVGVSLIISEIISAPLRVGGRRFFIEATQYRFNLGEIGFGFTNGFINIVKTFIIKDVFIFLWSLLLIIPGIIKYYSYYLVGFILAENPNMDYKRALQLSQQMTDGYKMEIFVLSLSFLGWILLGLLCLGIGVFFVQPYVYATEAEMYLFLRARALDMGIVQIEELTR